MGVPFVKHYTPYPKGWRFMTLLVDVLEEHGLDSIDVVLFALPGVGDVGKNAVELLNEANEARTVARFIHPGLTPLARLDEDGLLAPPHLAACRIDTENGPSILTITGRGQPSESFQQHDFTTELLKHLSEAGMKELIVLAGLMSTPEIKEAFAVATTSSHRVHLEEQGVDVRRDQPSGGALACLPSASLAPRLVTIRLQWRRSWSRHVHNIRLWNSSVDGS